MFLPRHEILLVKEDGTKKSIMCTDCSNKKEVIEETKYYFKLNKSENYKKYVSVQYVDAKGNVLAELKFEEVFE